jgi:hypothetical protein
MRKLHIAGAAAVLATAAILTGCGGGGGDDSAPTTSNNSGVPETATSSVAGLIAYLGQLIAGTSETSEPVVLGDAALPVDDTAAPSALP